MTKEVKKPPVVEFMIPKKIFGRADPTTGERDYLLATLWDFTS